MQPLALVTATGVHPTAKLISDPPGRYRTFVSVLDKFERLIKAADMTVDHDVPDSGVPIFNQKELGSCVLNSTTRAMMVALFNEQQKIIPLSRLFAYWLCSKQMGTVGQDTGTNVFLAVERYGSIGVCDESVWPYTDDLSTFFVPPPGALEAVLEGSDNRPTAWVKIDETDPQAKLAQMETAILANHTICFGTPVSRAIQSYQAGQILTVPDPNAVIGGHSMQVTGRRFVGGKRVWRIANSWSSSYGDNGYLLIDDAWAADPGFSDLWVMSRIDGLQF